jgi:ribosomal protein L40E
MASAAGVAVILAGMLIRAAGRDDDCGMEDSRYVCSHCGQRLPIGARWCPGCHHGTDSSVFIAPETAGQVVPVSPERVLDPTPLRPAGEKSVSRWSERQRLTRPERSRWKKGATTFGPAMKVALTALILVCAPFGRLMTPVFLIAYVPIAGLLLFYIWRKDQVDRSKAPLSDSVRETVESFRRDRRQRQAKGRGAPEAPYVCARCSAWMEPGERTCYRCGSVEWRATRPTTEPVAICGACHEPWVGERPWCQCCQAPRSQVLWIQPR